MGKEALPPNSCKVGSVRVLPALLQHFFLLPSLTAAALVKQFHMPLKRYLPEGDISLLEYGVLSWQLPEMRELAK